MVVSKFFSKVEIPEIGSKDDRLNDNNLDKKVGGESIYGSEEKYRRINGSSLIVYDKGRLVKKDNDRDCGIVLHKNRLCESDTDSSEFLYITDILKSFECESNLPMNYYLDIFDSYNSSNLKKMYSLTKINKMLSEVDGEEFNKIKRYVDYAKIYTNIDRSDSIHEEITIGDRVQVKRAEEILFDIPYINTRNSILPVDYRGFVDNINYKKISKKICFLVNFPVIIEHEKQITCEGIGYHTNYTSAWFSKGELELVDSSYIFYSIIKHELSSLKELLDGKK